MARIVFTFDAEWDHKEQKRLESQQLEFQGGLLPPRKGFDYFQVNKDGGGIVYVPTINIEMVETFLTDQTD